MAKHDAEAFHFPEHYDPLPELTDEVDRLWHEGRYESALDVILRFLRAEGRSAEAFHWALMLLGTGQRRTPDPRVVEPVTPQQYGNPYFAPIATECARCERLRFWYSGHALVEHAGISVVNPVGLQCQVCRYSLCRDCLDLRDRRCPDEGCHGELGAPVLPTGCPRGKPANTCTEKLEHVLILWRDTPTSQEEAEELLDLACTWQERGGITVRSQANQADKRDGEQAERQMGLVLVGLYERHGMISEGGLLQRTRVVPIESPGRGQRLVFVTAAPATGAASQLSGPVNYLLFDEPDTDDEGTRGPKRRWFRRGR
ncbi:hypothetical protein [Streptomyces sp. TRM68367]|uniref:hypothetical protein n=1 Tax=Streptomyces sp. TRM68367 TaxID=2758415 RepID=UPI00165C83EC|nr:hypothetical protein [Streptomyces sp. TRM68367]MBC9731068.1 hypothetical protein [Streptomyces sp. TRM68367]